MIARNLGVYIPPNRYGIRAGYYSRAGRHDAIPGLLRLHKHKPATVQFIADMLE